MSAELELTPEEVRGILGEVVRALAEPENCARLDKAKEVAGNEMLKMMQVVFPAVEQVQMGVLLRHGFAAGREGLVRFTRLVREAGRTDAEVARLHSEIRSHFLPPVSVTSAFDASL